ncbi:MAG: hypothetical protein WCI77_07105 [Candidatus Omnitrophota bacterium]
MNRRWRGLIIFVSLFFLNVCNLYADEMESKFKDIITQIAADLQVESSVGKGLEKEKGAAIENNLVECQSKLKSLIKTNPQSIWADDAQYVIAILSATNPKQEALELEYLLKEYPSMHIEDWTREAFAIAMPNQKIPFEVMVRLQLCMDYKKCGDTEKLKHICEESIKKYPEKAKIFENLLQETDTAS